MATKIHHNTAKKAKTHGIELRVDGNEIVAIKNGVRLASHMSGTIALQTAIDKLAADAPKPVKVAKPRKSRDEDEGDEGDEFEEDGEEEAEVEADDEEESDEGKSVVKAKYKQAYKPFKHRCGTSIADQISAHVAGESEDGKPCVDMKKLKRFARANECWVESYSSLNNGMARMNVANRLNAKIKKGFTVVWA